LECLERVLIFFSVMARFDEKVGNYLAGTQIPLSPIGKTLLEIIKREQGGSGSSKALRKFPSLTRKLGLG